MVRCHHSGMKIPKKPINSQKTVQNKGDIMDREETCPLNPRKTWYLVAQARPIAQWVAQQPTWLLSVLHGPLCLLPGQDGRATSLCPLSCAHAPLHWHIKCHRGYEVSKDTSTNSLCECETHSVQSHLFIYPWILSDWSCKRIRPNALAVN